ncbi:MAG: glutamine--fructose-6-phosphate transaminase (isomerizing) [Firmicutes bacterium]|nr:glutamine--fructose-6-phosphate transaminase (isomerizing) [Bacillota bacterium]
MCGIVGYVGSKLALPVLMRGLASLEYRGYDSAGVVFSEQSTLTVFKRTGRINSLNNYLKNKLIASGCGIGHTRWATHGGPSNTNSHPHTDEFGSVAVVHNGIIENYAELKACLIAEGVVFKSETDTEVIAHLLSKFYKGNPLDALIKTCKLLHGSYALAALFKADNEQIVAARNGSPLVIGIGQNENFIASDALALLPYTNSFIELNNNQFSVITQNSVKVYDPSGKKIAANPKTVQLDIQQAVMGNYPHYMLKEINEVPRSVTDTLAQLENNSSLNHIPDSVFAQAKDFHIVACGTALNAGLVLKDLLARKLRLNVTSDFASEFRYKSPKLSRKSLCIFISQSGETADTLACVQLAKEHGAITIAVTNVVGSTICSMADYIIPTRAGPEIAVASTKAYSAQLTAGYYIALHMAKLLRKKALSYTIADLYAAANVLEAFLPELNLSETVSLVKSRQSIYYIGRGLDYCVALEGSLKLKEISYIHCEAFPCGELKHGSLALIEPNTFVLCIITQADLIEKSVNAIHEIKARGGKVILLTQFPSLDQYADITVTLPQAADELMPLISVLPLQLLAYKTAAAKGFDPDKPRNLAKSVTVE